MIMLPRPIRRSALSSISAIDATSDRQRPGYRKGIIPSITSTKLIAMPKSRHIILQPRYSGRLLVRYLKNSLSGLMTSTSPLSLKVSM